MTAITEKFTDRPEIGDFFRVFTERIYKQRKDLLSGRNASQEKRKKLLFGRNILQKKRKDLLILVVQDGCNYGRIY